MSAPLAGQTAWITGSSRGLGRVMAEELVRLGANVAIHGTRQDSPRTFGEGESMEQVAADVAESGPGEAMACWCDVTIEQESAVPGVTSVPPAPPSAREAAPKTTTA